MNLCSLWSILLLENFEPIVRLKKSKYWNIKSDLKVLNSIIGILRKLLSCPMCFSYWLFSFYYLLNYHSFLGFIIGIFVYYLTFIIKKYLLNISI
jgi:hypothetical protein